MVGRPWCIVRPSGAPWGETWDADGGLNGLNRLMADVLYDFLKYIFFMIYIYTVCVLLVIRHCLHMLVKDVCRIIWGQVGRQKRHMHTQIG